jgi:hypothetical protein
VNAIMISLVVGLVLRKIEEHRNLIIPTIVLLCANLAVVILSILSMRAGRERLRVPEEIAAHDRNLFVTFTDLKVSMPDYVARMKGLLSDGPSFQDAMFECLYFGRNLIVQRRRMLQLTYDIFIYGLAISLVLFIAAILFW